MGWSSDSKEQEEDATELFRKVIDLDAFYPRNRSHQMFRVVASFPDSHIRGGPGAAPKPDRHDDIVARDPRMPATWGAAKDHLTWQHSCTPFVSFFTKFDVALGWKNYFIRDGAHRVRIFCYDTKHVPSLLDANELANKLQLHTLEDIGERHHHEYLIVGGMSGRACLGVYEFTR